MSVGLLLPSKEINGSNDVVQGPGINIFYDQNVHGKENKAAFENSNVFHNLCCNLCFQWGDNAVAYLLLKGQRRRVFVSL